MPDSNETPRPRRVPLIAGGRVTGVVPTLQGVELEITAGCGNADCPGCQGWVIRVLTLIEPTNFRIVPGARAVLLSRQALGLISPSGHQTIFRRRGIYRRQSAAFRGHPVR